MTRAMKTRMLACLALALVLGSCQKDSKKDAAAQKTAIPEIIAEAGSGLATRTMVSVDDDGIGTISWAPYDEINVFFGTTGVRYTSQNTSYATTAVFRTREELGADVVATDNIWGLYPYDKDAVCDGSSVTTHLPGTQRGVPETFDDDLFINLAHSTSNKLRFVNVCGGIKFSLTRSDIASVTFKGNNGEDLAGDISLTLVDGVPVATVIDGIKEITLVPRNGSTFDKDANYYIVTLPVTLSNGFTITFRTQYGSEGIFEYTDKPVTIKRSKFGRKADFDTYASFVGVNTIFYTTSDGQLLKLPYPDSFGAAIASHTYENGIGTITFDAPVSAIGNNAFSGCTTLTSITLLEGLTSIGDSAFNNCSGLTSLTIPSTVTSLGYRPFQYCTGLTSMYIPDNVTSVGNGLFYNSGVTSVSLGAIVESKPLSSALIGCNDLSVTVREGVTTIGDGAFSSCSFMTSISLPSSLTSIDKNAFSGCTGLTSLIIPSGVTSIGSSAFANCSGLTTMDIPAGVTSLASTLFSNCTGLTSVTLHDGLTNIGEYSFTGCSGLTSLTVPSTVTGIGSRAFQYCTGLTEFKCLPVTPPSAGSAMFYQAGECTIYVPAASVEAYQGADNWKTYAARIQAMI